MKKNLVLLFFLGLSSGLFGQSDNWFFSLNLGGSWPVGAFAKNTSSLNSGFAQQGFSLSIDANYPLDDRFSLKGMVLLNNNPVNRYWQLNQLVNRMTQFIPVSAQDQQYVSLNVNPWVTNGLLVGPNYTFTFDKFLLDFQVLAGLDVAYLPQQKLLYQNPANNWLYIHQNLNTVSFSYGLLGGTAIRFPVSDKIYLRLGIDFYYSRALLKFQDIQVTKEGATTVIDQLNRGKYALPIENISGTIGLVYYLN